MIPSNIQYRLASLRARERFLQAVWGGARLAAVVFCVIFLACLTDYLIDSMQETPWALRLVMFLLLMTSIVAGAAFFFWPLLRTLDDDELALWVEDKSPRLQHRLISAVQLNREGAQVHGMSMELVGVVTREAEEHAERIPFASAADHARLKRSAAVFVPALILLLVPLLVWPALSTVLLGRLFLADLPIERRVTLENITQNPWPAGDSPLVQVKVTGNRDKEEGKLVVKRGLVSDSYKMESKPDPASGKTIYFVQLQPSTDDITFNAYIGDGRLAKNGVVQFKARPVVNAIRAWTVLPYYCDPRPGHGPYAIEQQRGEVQGLPRSSVRVRAELSKNVKEVTLKLYGPESGDPAKPADKMFRPLTMTLTHSTGQDPGDEDSGTHIFECTFDLQKRETMYEIETVDRYGFKNDPVPRRSIHEVEEEKPTVKLLPEQIPGLVLTRDHDDVDLEGLPIPKGQPIFIAYYCEHKYGLGRASLKYRVIPAPKQGDSNDNVSEIRWQEYKLFEEKEGKGAFDPRRGAFTGSGDRDSVPFHAVESENPAHMLGRVVGGGRFLFQTAKIVDGKSPQEGDRIEYFIEVHPDRVPNGVVQRPVGRSETRVKNVVSFERFAEWMHDWNEEGRIRSISANEKKVFPTKTK